MDQVQALEAFRYVLTPSSSDWQAAGPYALSDIPYLIQHRSFHNPLSPQQSTSSTPLIVSLRI
jgi:hypothetical protein